MRSVYKIFAAFVLSLSLLTGTSFAAPAWQLPAQGEVFTDEAKQIYIANKMGKFFRGEVTMKFAAPSGWTYEKFSVYGVNVERLVNPKQKKIFAGRPATSRRRIRRSPEQMVSRLRRQAGGHD